MAKTAMTPDTRKTLTFALSWSVRWYQAAMGWDSTWLVLVVWVGVWVVKKWRTARKGGAE
jgi:hypothetical protein